MSSGPKHRSWLNANVVLLGVVSLLTDTASEMIVPLLPMFVTSVLGASALALGWIEGLAEAAASVLKLLSGRLSDRTGRRRPFVVAGYALASMVRPFVALATSAWHVLGIRVTDRIGKGLRTSPRDALIAASVEPHDRGAAFGLHRAMDHAGAVLGPLVATGVLLVWPTELRTLFWLTAIPGAAAVTVVAFGVREISLSPGTAEKVIDETSPGREHALNRLLLPLGLFTLGNASDLFLLLKAGATRAPVVTLPLLWVGLHIVKSLTSVPGGRLSDRFGRSRVIIVGWLFYAAIYSGFAFATQQITVWTLFVAYGLYHGLTEGAERALVSELVPARRWGGGFGWYYLTLGGLTLAASVSFGSLWELFGSQVAFLTSAGLAALAAVCLGIYGPPETPTERPSAEAQDAPARRAHQRGRAAPTSRPATLGVSDGGSATSPTSGESAAESGEASGAGGGAANAESSGA